MNNKVMCNNNNCQNEIIKIPLKLVAFELTKKCNLNCLHCRAYESKNETKNELTFKECCNFLDELLKFKPSPMLILSGGEPLVRNDFFNILEYVNKLNIPKVLATNATLIDLEIAKLLKKFNVLAVSVSLDSTNSKEHNLFRQSENAFEKCIDGINLLKQVGLKIQLNVSVYKKNYNELEEIFKLAESLNIQALHIFLLVPVGNAINLKEQLVSPFEYEEILNWFYNKKLEYLNKIDLKATCAPAFQRIIIQNAKNNNLLNKELSSRGCLAGNGFAFVSAYGEVFGCGYLPVEAGNIRNQNFFDIYENSLLFQKLRDLSQLKGKCGECKFKVNCGGCRARALFFKNDFLDEDPCCYLTLV